MARNENRRRKKLEVRKAKRKEQKRTVARFQSASMHARMLAAKDWPVLGARMSSRLWDNGIGYVAIARRGRNHQAAAAIFLVDTFCLGVKDIVMFVDSETKWFDFVSGATERGQQLTDVSPEYARKVVEGAVAFARSYGLQPYRDWPTAALIFADLDATQCPTEFTFGKDGKPLFIPGPYDSPERVQQIMVALAQSGGSEGIIHFASRIDGDMQFESVEEIDDDENDIDAQSDDIEVDSEIRHDGAR